MENVIFFCDTSFSVSKYESEVPMIIITNYLARKKKYINCFNLIVSF